MTMSAERRAKLIALGEVHDAWVRDNLASADGDFSPAGRKDGSDYNQHYLDIEASGPIEDAFHAAAMEVMK